MKLLNNENVKLFDVWSFVNYYRLLASGKVYYKLQKDLINSLLTYEEVFIRKQVAKIFFQSKIDKNEVLLIEKFFNDVHPTVVFYGIWGSLLSWNKQTDEVKSIVFDLFKKLLCRQEIAIRANNLLTTFSVDYSGECIDWKIFSKEETIELWNIWGQIFPIFSNSLPPNISLNYGRFGNTMKTSMKYLTIENGIEVFNTWLKRIELKIKNKIEFSDYEMGIADDLIEFTKGNVELRKNLIERILSNNNSIFCLYNLKIMTSYWEVLNLRERKLILRLINSNRIDQRWIKAMLLTKYEVPREIELKIVGDVNLFSLKPQKVIEIMSAELIYDCLKIIYAKPYELQYLRPSYVSDFWKRMINYILFYQIEPFFDICIKDFIHSNIFVHRSDNFLLWRKICLNSQNINYLTYLIVYNISKGTINVNGTMMIMKNLIFAYQERNEYEVFINIIADEIEVLQQTSDKKDIFYIFDKDLIFNDLYKNIFPDLAAKIIIEKTGIEFLETFIDGIDFETFRFFYSYLIIEKLVNENDKIDEEVKKKLLSIPNIIDKVGDIKKSEIKRKYFKEEKIENWMR
ncbi:hypothetical protein HNP99_001960 [Flavobacterium sp. 28A]|uniref:hypothetical protein n=1 Tax=Flavobacterium sp. 28A TaxID=2735895 RepID=UPI00156F89C4|nr:hypothetical protein [Flavobacterium sp. 28A]NRT15603.1 hypothetical protein [Flavobacterium sp. 28A]